MNHKYYIIQSSNGNVDIVSEWNDLNSAIVAYHDRCKVLWNAKDVIEGYVEIVYSAGLNVVSGYKETITHAVEPELTKYTEITDTNAKAEADVTYYVLIDNQYVEDTGVNVGDRVFGKYVMAE